MNDAATSDGDACCEEILGSFRGNFRGNCELDNEENVLDPADRCRGICVCEYCSVGANDLLDVLCGTRFERASGRHRSPTVFIREVNIISRSLESVFYYLQEFSGSDWRARATGRRGRFYRPRGLETCARQALTLEGGRG